MKLSIIDCRFHAGPRLSAIHRRPRTGTLSIIEFDLERTAEYTGKVETQIIRSKRRKKTVEARLVDNTIIIRAPYNMPDDDLRKMVRKLKERLLLRQKKKELGEKEDLRSAFDRLNRKYFDGRLEVNSIEYSTAQKKRHGSFSLRTGTIRISHRLADMPRWVRDYVLIHEMAHLIEFNHGHDFWKLVNRYELAERARGFLMAKDFHEAEEEPAGGDGCFHIRHESTSGSGRP